MKLESLNTIFIGIIFIWQAVQLNFLEGFDGAGRISSSIAVLTIVINLIANSEYRNTITNNSSVKIWIVWLIYAIINTVFLYDESVEDVSTLVFVFNRLLVPFAILSVVASYATYSIDQMLKYATIIFYIVSIAFFLGSSLEDGRYLNELFNINELILLIMALITTILVRAIRENIMIIKVMILMAFPTYFVIMAGSRMGFGAFLILLVGYLFAKRNKNIYVFIFQISIVLFLSTFLLSIVLDNTLVGERLTSTTEQSEEFLTESESSTILKFFGDRGTYYINGWKLFKENPFFGIGFLNYIKSNRYVCHVEYVIHLAELGAIGFILYFLFLRSLFINLSGKIKTSMKKSCEEFVYFILFSILFCALVLFLYNSFAVAYMFGLIILLSKNEHQLIT